MLQDKKSNFSFYWGKIKDQCSNINLWPSEELEISTSHILIAIYFLSLFTKRVWKHVDCDIIQNIYQYLDIDFLCLHANIMLLLYFLETIIWIEMCDFRLIDINFKQRDIVLELYWKFSNAISNMHCTYIVLVDYKLCVDVLEVCLILIYQIIKH